MSGRHLREVEPRAVVGKLMGVGVAGAAAALAVAPAAHASPAPTPTNAGTGDRSDAGTGIKTPSDVSRADVTPDYGFQKIRVGVQIKDGSWVPDGTTTAGTTLTIEETGPSEPSPETTECTTSAATQESGSTATWCVFTHPLVRTPAAVTPTPVGDVPPDQLYTALPGDTVTVTQTTVEPNLVIDSQPQVVPPCDVPGGVGVAVCDDAAVVTLDDPGLPPAAVNDSSSVAPGGSVRVQVLANDTTHDAPPTVAIVARPAHGTAKVIDQTSAGGPVIAYTPDAGFVGYDSLRYSLTTGNGTSIATVRVHVAGPPKARDDAAKAAPGTAVTVDVLANDRRQGGGTLSIRSVGDPAHGHAVIRDGKIVYTPDDGFAGTDTFTYVAANSLGTDTATVTVTVSGVANTGVDSGDLTGLAALLLVSGGAATAAGRRRHHGRHARTV